MDDRKLFYTDPYLKEFDAEVISCFADRGLVKAVLDRTAFYPEGGGQPCDAGSLILSGGEKISVTDVHEKNGAVEHTVSCGIDALPPGTRVRGAIDWDKRFDHMQQHSGEHIVSGIICGMFGCDNIGFHMGESVVTIDYDAAVSFEQMLEIEAAANRYIWENHPVSVLWPGADELEAMEYRSKKKLFGDVRVVSFPGADTCACCGTHVKSSAEVGLVKLLSAVKFHDGTRFELLCGKRAFDYLSACFMQDREIGIMLNAKATETAAVVKKQREELSETRARLSRAEDAWFAALSADYSGCGDVLLILEPLSPDSVRRLAVLIGSVCGGRAAVFAGEGSDFKYTIAEEGGELSSFTKEMNAALSGRGGGRGSFAQGFVNASEKKIRRFFGQ